MDGPRRARRDEYTEAMAFIDRVFRPGQRGRCILQSQYPHAYGPDRYRRLVLVREEGSIVGCLAVHPITYRVEGEQLQAGGIGAVGTESERRGRGIMTAMLHHAVERMEREGCAISVLGGDRQRYGWFGWERGGVRNCFSLLTRYVGKPSTAERKLLLERFDGDPATCRRVRQLGLAHPYWVERTAADVVPLLKRRDRESWVCREGRRFAYVACSGVHRQPRPYERVDEAGGDPDLVMSMIRVLMARYHLPHLHGVCGPNPEETARYEPYSADWHREHDGMVRIIDLERVVASLAPVLRRRARRAAVAGVFELAVSGTEQRARLTLGDQRPVHRVALTPAEMVRLLFGQLPVAEALAPRTGVSAAALDKLSLILPLPLHLPALNHV
ncbi:GNAT family N-acetyltransferase [Candidatus Latescibacterota bacterium]